MYVPAAFHRLPPLYARPLAFPAAARPDRAAETTTAAAAPAETADTTTTAAIPAETTDITADTTTDTPTAATRSTPLRARWQTVSAPDGRPVLVASWHADR
ncbi:hypothetical protein ACIQF6_19025 [Kitasatospora sp. NPDC092948]|uniref:hypothetical protein n=1 Tax=Kitasatospora sp. NPDC092948 TaxID=3364088 RepID=UPI00380D87F0